jgi:hypothetical protein
MSQKEEGVSIWTVLILLCLISATLYYMSGPVWHDKPVTTVKAPTIITSDHPMTARQYVRSEVQSSGWGMGVGNLGFGKTELETKVKYVMEIQELSN